MRYTRNVILPFAIILLLLAFMVGCIYIPTFDHTLLAGTKSDFREWAEYHKRVSPSLLSSIKRRDIEAMFGKPAFESIHRRNIAYVMGTENGIQIWPLCFGAGFVDGNAQVMKLIFDDKGQLKRVVLLEGRRDPPLYWFGESVNGDVMFHHGSPDPMDIARYLVADENDKCSPDEIIELKFEGSSFRATTEHATTQHNEAEH